MIRKQAWPFFRTICGVRLSKELEEPKGPKGLATCSKVQIFFSVNLGVDREENTWSDAFQAGSSHRLLLQSGDT